MFRKKKNRPVHVAIKGIIVSGGRALILCRNDAAREDGSPWWEFPGGTLEYGETPEQTLVREFREETGLEVLPDRLLYVSSVLVRNRYEIVIITYLCRCDDVRNVRLSKEHSACLWADADVLRNRLADDILEAMDKNGIWALLGKAQSDEAD